jgi:aerobic C4-dicarboxylate transport protein
MSDHATTPGSVSGDATGKKPALWSGLGFQVGVSVILGIAVGLLWPETAASLKVLGDLFLRLIKTAVAPLVFLTVTVGILAAGDIKRIGKVGLSAMIYFEVVSSIALAFGMLSANLFGVGKDLGQMTANASAVKGAAEMAKQATGAHVTFSQFLMNIFPDNFIGAFAKGELLQVLLIALVFGFGLLHLGQQKRAPIEGALHTISTAFFEFIHVIMRLAPIGTFGAVAYAVGANGTAVLVSLAYLVAVFYLAVLLFIGIVLGAVSLIFRFSLFDLLKFIRDELVIVFGTASSESVLPRLLEKLPLYGASKQTVGLVLPTGFAFNLDGTSLFMPICTIFVANAYNVPLSFEQQLGLLLVMLITSKGAATVSGGTFVVFAATVASTGILPLDGLALVFGVYRFMSMINAVCNIVGNSVATIVVAKLCGEFDPTRRDDPIESLS